MYAVLKYWELIKRLLINEFQVFKVGKILQYEVIFLSKIIVQKCHTVLMTLGLKF